MELWPYAVRSRGIGVEQIFAKLGGFFSTYVNPLAMDAIGWRFMAAYTGWLGFELGFIYLFYPETYGRSLEELAFCKYPPGRRVCAGMLLIPWGTVFENDELIAKQAEGTEKNIHAEEVDEQFDTARKTETATHV